MLRPSSIGPALVLAALASSIFTHASPLSLNYVNGPDNYNIGATGYTLNGGHRPFQTYTPGGGGLQPLWIVSLTPDPPEYLRAMQIADIDALETNLAGQQGWQFASAADELPEGSLEVRTYKAVKDGGGVGANFHVAYTGPAIPNAHWIQVITTNHPHPGDHPAAGAGLSTYVDTDYLLMPFYDYDGTADADDFVDTPRRTDITANHTWRANLYLVTAPGWGPDGNGNIVATPGLLTVLGGIQWGWVNHCVEIAGAGGSPMCALVNVPEPAAWHAEVLAGMLFLLIRVRRSRSQRLPS